MVCKEPLFKEYSDLRDKFLKISLKRGEILDKFDGFWENYALWDTFKKKFNWNDWIFPVPLISCHELI